MKILWIVNNPTPEMSSSLGIKSSVYGGWISSLCALFKNDLNHEICIATEYKVARQIACTDENIKHVVIPSNSNGVETCQLAQKGWIELAKSYTPDVVHIHGTENTFGYNYIIANGNQNVIASIQGLTSVYSRYYTGGMSELKLHRYSTIYDYIRKTSFFHNSLSMKIRGQSEIKLIQSINHIIGRTIWDKTHALSINNSIAYHKCNEVLRPVFYDRNWSQNKMQKKRIFVSNVRSTVKGGIWAFRIFREVLRYEPDAVLVVAGGKGILDQMNEPSYKRHYLRSLLYDELVKIPDYQNKVELLGSLSENEMCEEFLKSNVYLLSSVIENSSNSLGEAQILGVPVVASYVGGNAEFLDNGNAGGLFRLEEYEMAASQILHLFNNSENEKRERSKRIAEKRHCKSVIYSELLTIYNKVKCNK